MKELSLNILDITQNSLTAGATLVGISLLEDEQGILTLTIFDDGKGMSEEIVKGVTNPFYTTRTTRKVGLGLPLLKLAAEQAGGDLKIVSRVDDGATLHHGTTVTATFDTKSIDFTPIGDMVSTLCTLIQGNDKVDFEYIHKTPAGQVTLSTKEMRQMLGEDIPLSSFEVLAWVKEYLIEQYDALKK